MKIIWSPIALQRFQDVLEFIELDGEQRTAKVAKSLLGSIEGLKRFPKSGRTVPEMRREDVREIVKMGFRIIYCIDKSRVIILTVRHVRRRFSTREIAVARDIVEPEGPMRGPIM